MPTHIYSANIKVKQVKAFQNAYLTKQKYSNSMEARLYQLGYLNIRNEF